MNDTIRRLSRLIPGALLLATLTSAPAVLADPPPWAPAHGYREHQDRDGDEHDQGRYRGYDNRAWNDDYGVVEGHCDRAAVGAVLGGVVGGVVGSQVGKGDDRPVAIFVGAAIGSILGHAIGHDMDRADRGCLGHALELAHDREPVRWRNERTNVDYVVVPMGAWPEGGRNCREFKLKAKSLVGSESNVMHACRSRDGEWHMT